jgi:uncharacterized delta-60 repeat protein
MSKAEIYAQQGKVDATFNTLDDGLIGDGFDNTVRTLTLQSDQNLIVGGDYLNLNGIHSSYLTRLKPDGTIDENFDTGPGFNGKVYTSYIQPDGKIIVGGSFTSFNGIPSGRLVRLNPDGSYDPSFNTTIGATTGTIYEISPQSDGKIIIVGSFTRYNNVGVNRVVRILSNGALDTSFMVGSGAPTLISNVCVLDDGKILLAGNFTSFNSVQVNKIVRLLSDGQVDTIFNVGTGFDDDVNAMAVQADGKILVGGKFTNYNGLVANRIVRINNDGTLDGSFISGSGFSAGAVQKIKTDALGDIMIGGSFTGSYNGNDVNRICLLNSRGILKTDVDFGSGPASASVLAIANDLEGSWYIGGSFSVFDGLNQGRLAKINSEGEYDTGYLSAGIGFDNSVLKVISLDNKKTMVFGNFKKFNGVFASRITCLLEDGSMDVNFNASQSGANNLIKNAVLQTDGKIICGGNFTKYNETLSNRIIRILPNGIVDETFIIGTGLNSQVYAMAIQSDQKIIVGGNFTRYNDSPAGRIIRLLPNGQRDISFNVGYGFDAIVEAILVQQDGKVLIAGRFNSFDGHSTPRLVRLNSDGSMDSGFNVGNGFDKYVYAIALQSDQKILLGGSFVNYNGSSQKRIIRLNSDGSLDNTFQSGTGFSKGDVRAILIQPDDKILVGGTFSGTYKNIISQRLIRLLKSGDFDSSFDARLNNKLYTMSFTANQRLMIGGDFNSVSGISKHRIARLKLCLETTIWNGSDWSNGLPSGGKEISFKEDYPSLTTANVCSCTIDFGKTVTLLSGNTLGIEFSYFGLGTLVLQDSANLYQSDDDMVNTGVIHLKRKTSPITRFDYTYWSSPVDHQKLVDVSPNTQPDKYYSYNYGWQGETPSNNMIVGKGYIIRGPNNFSDTVPEIYEAVFKGIPNNGVVETNVSKANVLNLIGNPYPSTLDADAFLNTNKGKITGMLYFWTHNTPYANNKYALNDYAFYNRLGGVGTSAALASGINESVPDGKIGSGQGFCVRSLGEGTIEFNDSMRMTERNSIFFKPGKSNNKSDSTPFKKHRIWLNIQNPEGLFKQILVGYIDGASNLYDDDFDAESVNSNQFVDFYSIVENKRFVIQGRALPFEDTDFIPLGYTTTIEGELSLSIDHKDGIFERSSVFVEDKVLKITHDLKDGPYLFLTQKGTFDDRFVIKYVDSTLKKDDFEKVENELFVSVKDKNIRVKSVKEVINEVSIYDISGKLLYNKKKVDDLEVQLSTLQFLNQVLIVKTTLKNGFKIDKRILF